MTDNKKEILTPSQKYLFNLMVAEADKHKAIAAFWGGTATGKTYLLNLLEKTLHEKYKK